MLAGGKHKMIGHLGGGGGVTAKDQKKKKSKYNLLCPKEPASQNSGVQARNKNYTKCKLIIMKPSDKDFKRVIFQRLQVRDTRKMRT